MANTEKGKPYEKEKHKIISEIEDIKELAKFREKKKIQNQALKKIVNGFNVNEIKKNK